MKELKNSRESIQCAHSFSQEECLSSQKTPLLQLFGFFRSLGSVPVHKVTEEFFAVLFYSLPSLILESGRSKKTALHCSPTTGEGDYH